MNKAIGRAVGACVAATAVGMLIAGSFLGALHEPRPHEIPVGTAGSPVAVRQLGTELGRHAPGAFDLKAYPSPAAARSAILDRAVDGAVVLNQGHPRLIVAGAAGRFVIEAIVSAFQRMAASGGQTLLVTDIRPLPAHDPNGVSPVYAVIALILPSLTFGVLLGHLAGRRMRPAAQLLAAAALGAFSCLIGAAVTWVADGLVGALTGAPLHLFGVAVLTAFAISTASATATRWAGLPGGLLLALAIFPVGIPASGGPFGPNFVPSWYGHLGIGLPPGAAITAIRNVVYFSGNGLAGAGSGLASPLLVLCIWAAAGLLGMAWPLLPRRPQPSEPTTLASEPAAAQTAARRLP